MVTFTMNEHEYFKTIEENTILQIYSHDWCYVIDPCYKTPERIKMMMIRRKTRKMYIILICSKIMLLSTVWFMFICLFWITRCSLDLNMLLMKSWKFLVSNKLIIFLKRRSFSRKSRFIYSAR